MKNFIYTKGLYTDEKGREFFFDNAKWLLILFVVTAHIMGTMMHSDNSHVAMLTKGIWSFFNTFHMAAFIFISGYFAKRFVKKGYSLQKPATYFIIYLAAQIMFILLGKFLWKTGAGWTIFRPQSSLWFLQCMTIWYLLLPMLEQVKPKYMIIGAIVLAIVAGYDKSVNDVLSFSRVLVHLPFFMSGYYMDKSWFEKLNKCYIKLVSALFLLGIFAADLLLGNKLPGWLLTCNTPYAECGFKAGPALWGVYRLLFYIVAFLMIFAFLSLVPRCKTFFTTWGSRTLAVYILHMIVYRSFKSFEWYKYFEGSLKGVIIVAGIILATVVILSLKPFSVPFDLLMKIKIKPFLKEKE